jgi:hypothetical protein
VPDVTVGAGFACADLTTFCRLDELGLEVTGQRLEPDRAVLACRVVDPTPGAAAGIVTTAYQGGGAVGLAAMAAIAAAAT